MRRSFRRSLRSLCIAVVALFAVVAAQPAAAFCLFNCSYTKTKHPIVLAHGLAGSEEYLGILDYWFGIENALEDGGANVFVTQVSPLNTPQARGEQLIDQIETILAVTGKPKVNLIGHSQGGLDIRYVAATRPDLVASVTTVGSPHKGADLADFLAAGYSGGGFTQAVLSGLGSFLEFALELLTGTSAPNDAVAALQSLTTASMATYNAQYPAGVPTTSCGSGAAVVNGIRNYSWSGTGVLTNALDLLDPGLGVTSLFYDQANDGLVDRCSSRFGSVIRDDYFMNHLDEVNQILGLVSIFESNPKTVFRAHANRLKNAGL